MNFGILLAGGIGKRAGDDVPKQFVCAGGHMMLTYALAPLVLSPNIDRIYIVAAKEWRNGISKDINESGYSLSKLFGFVNPGDTRQGSILNALSQILRDLDRTTMKDEHGNRDTVLIHDAARPFTSVQLIENLYAALSEHDGVMPVLPMKDTVYLSRDGKHISELLNRREIYAGQAPELFRLSSYYWANMSLLPEKITTINGASEPAIMAGMDIAMIPGDEENFKVTTTEDMKRFRCIKENS